MLKIYLLRHGATEFNEKEIVQGWNDSPLTTLGKYQAQCAGYGAKEIEFSKAYSGDLLRQINTAQLFLKENNHSIDIIQDSNFREMCYGKYQYGTYFNMLNPLFEMHNVKYGGYSALYKYMDDFEIASEITLRDETKQTEGEKKVWNRFSIGLEKIIKENDDGNILLSTSSFAIAVVIKNLFPNFEQHGLVDNCSLTVLSYNDGKYKLEEYNNIQYRLLGEKYLKR